MSNLSTDQVRGLAAAIILDHARDVEYLSISEHLEDLNLGDDHDATTDAVDKLIREAAIEVSWPDADPVVSDTATECPPGCTGNYPNCPLA